MLCVFTVVITLLATRQIQGMQLRTLRTADLSQFDKLIMDSIETSDIRAVKIWNREGVVVYSSFDKEEIGKVYPGYENFEAALAGEGRACRTGARRRDAVRSRCRGGVRRLYRGR